MQSAVIGDMVSYEASSLLATERTGVRTAEADEVDIAAMRAKIGVQADIKVWARVQ